MNGLRYVGAAVATLVVLWLAAGLLAHPAAFGAVALLALLPLALVVLPLLVSLDFAERSMTVRRTGHPNRLPGDETAEGTVRARVRSRLRKGDSDRSRPAD
ncbi:MAG: hypothetical protein V5A62_04060 [Haloarculaceae archaeon]